MSSSVTRLPMLLFCVPVYVLVLLCRVGSTVVGNAWGLLALKNIKRLYRKVFPYDLSPKDFDTCESWKREAARLDTLNHNDEWKSDCASPYYYYQLIKARLDRMRSCRKTGDAYELMNFIRSGLSRNMGGISESHLYYQCLLGTKRLIDEYLDSVCEQLRWIAGLDFAATNMTPKNTKRCRFYDNMNKSTSALDDFGIDASEAPSLSAPLTDKPNESSVTLTNDIKLQYFTECLTAFGRSALILDGGVSLGVLHLGVIKTLLDHDAIPSIVCGASFGGSIIASFICTMPSAYLASFFADPTNHIKFSTFKHPEYDGSTRRKIIRFMTQGHLMDIGVIEKFLRDNFGNMTFREAYHVSKKNLNILVPVCIGQVRKHYSMLLLNHVNAPNVTIWSAACVSGYSLGFCESATLYAKNTNGSLRALKTSDIGWGDNRQSNAVDMIASQVSHLYRVNNFIISEIQCYRLKMVDILFPKLPVVRSACLLSKAFGMLWSEASHYLRQLDNMALLPSHVKKAFHIYPIPDTQSELYLTLSPIIELSDLLDMLSPPTPASMKKGILSGERNTWPHLHLLLNRIKVERTLSAMIEELGG